jgi:spermidine/putrescine-binding protein
MQPKYSANRSGLSTAYRMNGCPVLSIWLSMFMLAAAVMVSGCSGADASPAEQELLEELVFYNWTGDIPQSVLDGFEKAHGIHVRYETYESQEEAIENIRAGHIYDVVNLDNRFIPKMIEAGLLAPVRRKNVPNFKNISPNFRNLRYDPGNAYSVPFNWGTTGILVRKDLSAQPVQRWSDLWRLEFRGKVGIWTGEPRETIGMALKSLDYSANSTSPVEIDAALQRLLLLRPYVYLIDEEQVSNAGPMLADNTLTVSMGWSFDAMQGQQLNPDIEYVYPEEGILLWGDNFVIPANSQQQHAAELFLNYMLKPETAAEIINYNFYATANEAARPLINPDILNNPIIFPHNEALKESEIILPLSNEVEALYDSAWRRFLEAQP